MVWEYKWNDSSIRQVRKQVLEKSKSTFIVKPEDGSQGDPWRDFLTTTYLPVIYPSSGKHMKISWKLRFEPKVMEV